MTAKERLEALLLDLLERFTSRSFLLVVFEAFVVFSPRIGVNFTDREVVALTAVVVTFIGGNAAVKIANNYATARMAINNAVPMANRVAGSVSEQTPVNLPPSHL